ncbi:hypothetical protein ACFX1Q_030529 [Malus domestica]
MAADGAAAAEASPPRSPLSRIYEQREETMVSLKHGQKQKRRLARFLKPCATGFTTAVGPPKIPLLCEVFPHDLQQWPSKVFFKGWKIPQGKWDEWVDRLAGKYCSIWNQSGICDAILSSRYEIRGNNKNVLLGLVEFWSPETNTFVFPWGEATITLEDVMVLGGFSALGRNVTRPVTACLSQGKRVALAPAILSGLFRDLSLLKNRVLSGEEEISVSGPFQLLQLWALERFPSPPKALKPGEPRAARWHKVASKSIGLPLVRTVFKLQENFQWRPYSADLSNLRHSSYYRENKPVFFGSAKHADENLKSYVRCLCPSELIGVEDSKEKYFPHRVAMQFGIDQDLPGEFPGLDFAACNDIGFFVPPWSFEPCVTARYLDWWEKSKSARADAIRKEVMVATQKIKRFNASVTERKLQMQKECAQTLTKSKPEKNYSYVMPEVSRKSNTTSEKKTSAIPPKQVKKELPADHTDDDDDDDIPLSERMNRKFPRKVENESASDHSDDSNEDFLISVRSSRSANRPACLSNTSPSSGSTKCVSSTSLIRGGSVSKRKLVTKAEGFPAKKRSAVDFCKSLMKIATKGKKAGEGTNVQVDVPSRMGDKHKVATKVSEKAASREGKKAMPEGSFKKPMGVNDHKRNQPEKGSLKEVKKTKPDDSMESVEILTRVANLEKLLGLTVLVEYLELIPGPNFSPPRTAAAITDHCRKIQIMIGETGLFDIICWERLFYNLLF